MDILLGVGGAPDSQIALEKTAERVAATGDRLTVALLVNAHADTDVDELSALVTRTLANYDIEADHRIIEDPPGPALTALAEAEGFDRIVIGGGKRSPMGKIALGDVTEFVVLNAETTVTLVR